MDVLELLLLYFRWLQVFVFYSCGDCNSILSLSSYTFFRSSKTVSNHLESVSLICSSLQRSSKGHFLLFPINICVVIL